MIYNVSIYYWNNWSCDTKEDNDYHNHTYNLYDTDRQCEEILKVTLVSTSASCGTNMYIKHADINIKT